MKTPANIILSYLLLFLCITLVSSNSYSQKYIYIDSYNPDSLKLILVDQEGLERINTLNKLAATYSFEHMDSSMLYAEEAMTRSKEIEYREGIAEACWNFGRINFYNSNYPEALNMFFESLLLYEELDQKHSMAEIYFDIASTHFFASNYDKTIEYGRIALNIFREPLNNGKTVGNMRDTLKVLGGLYLAYSYMEADFSKNLERLYAIQKAKRKNNYSLTENIIIDLEIGFNYYALGVMDSALPYFNNALAYPDLNQDIIAVKHLILTWKTYMYQLEEKYDTAFYYFDSLFNWYNNAGHLYFAMNAAVDLGDLYYITDDLQLAEKYYLKANHIFEEMRERNSWWRHDSLRNTIFWGLELYLPIPNTYRMRSVWKVGRNQFKRMYEFNAEMGNTSEALKYHILYFNAVDTLNRLDQTQKMMDLQTRFESDEKERQIRTLAEQNEFNSYKLNQSRIYIIGLTSLVCLIIILAVILIRSGKLREQQRVLLLQQKLLRSQMNPHFLFNSLASIQNFIINQEPVLAGKYLSRFSKLVRNILDSSFEEFVPIEDEISTIKNYLELQKVRYSDMFNYSIEVDKAIDIESMQIPPMLAQPMIENSIEHGMKNKDVEGNIYVRLRLVENTIVFEVEDDGIGRDMAMEIMMKQDKDHKSIATAITRERIHALNRKLRHKIVLKIIDLHDDKENAIGTRVVFKFPVVFY